MFYETETYLFWIWQKINVMSGPGIEKSHKVSLFVPEFDSIFYVKGIRDPEIRPRLRVRLNFKV